MFIIQNIPKQKYFADIKHVTVTADSRITIDKENILVYIAVDIFVARCRDLHVINVK